jgi:tRNA dimethylallyltransferase
MLTDAANNNISIPLIVICGPTASGKTALGIKLAEMFDGEIISADSRQIYKYLDIGTAKPTHTELHKIKHHFINILTPDQTYSAGLFGDDAYDIVVDIHRRGKLPIVVGGSGLYIKSLCDGLFSEDTPTVPEIRKQLEIELEKEGIDTLYERLRQVDETLWLRYSDKNPRRMLRALEYWQTNGEKLSEAWNKQKHRSGLLPLYLMLDFDRDDLYERINLRTEQMWEQGLVQETERVLNMGYSRTLNALNTVGYKETLAYLDGDISQDEAINTIKKNTRRYAKRQLTWFRKQLEMVANE